MATRIFGPRLPPEGGGKVYVVRSTASKLEAVNDSAIARRGRRGARK